MDFLKDIVYPLIVGIALLLFAFVIKKRKKKMGSQPDIVVNWELIIDKGKRIIPLEDDKREHVKTNVLKLIIRIVNRGNDIVCNEVFLTTGNPDDNPEKAPSFAFIQSMIKPPAGQRL